MKRNESCKSFLLAMNQHITNDDSAVLIKEIIDSDLKNKQKDIIIQICEKGFSTKHECGCTSRWLRSSCNIHHEKNIKTFKTIAQKFELTTVKTSKTKRNCKNMIHNQLKSNSKRVSKGRRKIGEDCLEEIKEFWILNVHQSVWVDDAKIYSNKNLAIYTQLLSVNRLISDWRITEEIRIAKTDFST